jgi:hypothetical protein
MPQPVHLRQFVAPIVASWLADSLPGAQSEAMIPRSPLDDPAVAAFAWARFRRLMWLMLSVTIAMVIGACVMLYRENGFVSVHFYIATALGIGFMMLLTSALMGLVFLSHGTGHDDAIIDPLEDDHLNP